MADILDFDADIEDLPRIDQPYRAFGLSYAPTISVSFMFRDGRAVTYPYRRLLVTEFQPAGEGNGEIMIVRFDAGARIDMMTVEGSALYVLWGQLGEHRAAWVRELPEGGRLDGGVGVTAITRSSEPIVRPGVLRRASAHFPVDGKDFTE